MRTLIYSDLKNCFGKLNELSLRYVVLRNYSFLLGLADEPDKDIDVSVHSEDYERLVQVLEENGFVKGKQNFSLKHKSYYKVFGTKKVGFDIQKNGVSWNDCDYLGEEVFERRVQKEHLFILCPGDYVVMLICHSVLGKRLFRQKYVDEVVKTDFDEYKVYVELCRVFGSFERSLLRELKLGVSKNVPIKKLVAKFIIKHPFTFSRTFLRWVFMSRPNKPIIAFMGSDGSGKTTSIDDLFKTLVSEGRDATIKNCHMAQETILPIRKAATSTYLRVRNKEVGFKTKAIYFVGFFIYWMDSVLKYYLKIQPASARNVVVTDRWAYDTYLMKHTPKWLKRFFLKITPKPDLLIFLWNDVDVLMRRRKEHTKEDFERQLEHYKEIFDWFKGTEIMVKSENEDDRRRVIEGAMRFVYAKGF